MISFFIALNAEFKLLERAPQMSNFLLLIIIFCFLLVGWSGMRTKGFLNFLLKNFIRMSPKESEFNESLKINFGATLLLFFNLLIALSVCFFLLINEHNSVWESSLLAVITSIVFMFLQQFGFRFVSILTGEIDISESITSINRSTWQFGGILLLVIATLWILNIKQHEILSYSFIAALFLLLILRIIKGLFLSFKKRIRWYYFILYLCTLEILPAFVFVRLAFVFFQWEM